MKNFETIDLEITEPFAHIMLNRPDVRNAMNQQMVRELGETFAGLHDSPAVRGIVLSGAGGTFCAGGDIKEMQASYTDPNFDDGAYTEAFDSLLHAINTAPQVVVAAVEGIAMGGGLGLVCVADIAIAAEDAVFGLPEVRLGIIPALISPYIIQRVGVSMTRRLMLTGARFDGREAAAFGLAHEACPANELDERVTATLGDIRECGPEALAACKRLIFEVAGKDLDATAPYRAQLLHERKQSEEGHEGMLAFIQKRKPKWARVDHE